MKVSVSDFRSDVTAGKWQSYLRFANSVTFAAPAGLITKDQVPATCGLILRGPSGWRYAKKPVRQQLAELPWQTWIKLLLDGVTRANGEARTTYFREHLAEQVLAKKFGADVAQMLCDIRRLPQRYEAALAHHKKRLDDLQEMLAERQKAATLARQREAETCSGTLAKLAAALGAAPDATVTDLERRARQVLRLLDAQADRYQRHPLLDLAERMEAVALQAREVGTALTRRPEAAAPAESEEMVS